VDIFFYLVENYIAPSLPRFRVTQLLRRKTQLNSRDIRHLYYFGFFKSLSVMALDPIEGIREEGCQAGD